MPTLNEDPCQRCGGTGEIAKKAWTQGKPPKGVKVHPAIAAAAPAYRTIVRVPCDNCRDGSRQMTRNGSQERNDADPG